MQILAKIQNALSVPKTHKNAFGGYNYRTCEDILAAVKPLLEGAVLTMSDKPVFLSEKSVHKETNKNGEVVVESDRFYIVATATITHEGESISCDGCARESLWKAGTDASQITGSASSYARKAALSGLLMLDDNQDADSINKHETAVKNATPVNLITDGQRQNIDALTETAGMSAEETANGVRWASSTRTSSVGELSQEEAAKFIAMITKKIKQLKDDA